jgi:SAM-dependent methyltransferase
MTFFTSAAPPSVRPPAGLGQRGRAGLELLGATQKFAASQLRPAARAAFEASDDGARLARAHAEARTASEMRRVVAETTEIAERDPVWRLERFLQRYVAEETFAQAIQAVEERRPMFEAFLAPPAEPTLGTLELDPDLVPPKYYSATEWHLEPGSWDGYDLYGAVFAFGIGPLVFKHGGYAAVGVGDDILQQRMDTIRQLPKTSYGRIYEPGCGSATTLLTIHKLFPDAELVGCDLSPLLLRMGHKVAERQGIKMALKQRNAVHTGEPDASVDAVVTYALHHELPPNENMALFHEMFRILKPGGDIVMSDPPPFRAVAPFHAAILDWDTRHRNEPFFSSACLSNWDERLREAGFVDVQSYALGQDGYPWITRASKPA